MAGKNKKTELDFIKEIEAYEQQKKDAMEQLKAYQKSQTDKLGQIYFELKKLENPDLSIDELVVETQNKVKEVKKEIKQRKAEEKESSSPVFSALSASFKLAERQRPSVSIQYTLSLAAESQKPVCSWAETYSPTWHNPLS